MLNRDEILHYLRTDSKKELAELWARADRTREHNVGDEIHLRGLVEISNFCRRGCAYCGLRKTNLEVARYRMASDEVLQCADKAVELGYGTLVMQSGEDEKLDARWVASLIRQIKATTPLAVTLSLGERPVDDYIAFKRAGADRYLLRFETSDRALYEKIHPNCGNVISDRIEILKILVDLGFEAGSGVMVGIPGQTRETLAEDILLFQELDLDMIGVGPFIAHPETPLGRGKMKFEIEAKDQVPATVEMTCRVVALARLARPDANIPATTALATMDTANGRELALTRGANVVMPNLTPLKYREKYEIYPGKACVSETADACDGCIRKRIESIGRTVGMGPGSRKRNSGVLL